MSDSGTTTTNTHYRKFALALIAVGAYGCAADGGSVTIDTDGYDGIPTETVPLLAKIPA